ncbi:MAG: antibiotic biosynthesis monooxygenase [Rhodospirillales bacterium]|nr:antibiotic biosynthesis monooxygenase [Rhodospirillales bacterium]
MKRSTFGQINRITTAAGKRDEVFQLVLTGSDKMPGCKSYVVGKDAENEDVIWVSEVWDSPDLQAASLKLPETGAAVEEAMSMIVTFETVATTAPTIAV